MASKKKQKRRPYPPSLRGLATNRYGGNQLQRERGFKGSKAQPAGPVRIYTAEERAEYERELLAREESAK